MGLRMGLGMGLGLGKWVRLGCWGVVVGEESVEDVMDSVWCSGTSTAWFVFY